MRTSDGETRETFAMGQRKFLDDHPPYRNTHQVKAFEAQSIREGENVTGETGGRSHTIVLGQSSRSTPTVVGSDHPTSS
jgi:hypothetical protein